MKVKPLPINLEMDSIGLFSNHKLKCRMKYVKKMASLDADIMFG